MLSALVMESWFVSMFLMNLFLIIIHFLRETYYCWHLQKQGSSVHGCSLLFMALVMNIPIDNFFVYNLLAFIFGCLANKGCRHGFPMSINIDCMDFVDSDRARGC